MRVLVSAYACEPGSGSEPGVGWGQVLALSRRHDVLVVTRRNNRESIERRLRSIPPPHPQFEYYDLPDYVLALKRITSDVRGYYWMWQRGVRSTFRRVKRHFEPDVLHHLTMACYWQAAGISDNSTPFVLGPVGGGESVPVGLVNSLGLRGVLYEGARSLGRQLGEVDPLVRRAAREATIALASSDETAERLWLLGAREVRVLTQVGVDSGIPFRSSTPTRSRSFRAMSVGRLLPWKGFHLALAAFARASREGWQYVVVGSGPELARLQGLAADIGVGDAVTFMGPVSQKTLHEMMSSCDALLHPSLHDSGGMVCAEALAMGLPVVCVHTGGPPVIGARGTGTLAVPIGSRDGVVEGLANALRECHLRKDDLAWSAAIREEALRRLTWEAKARAIEVAYRDALAGHGAQG